MKIEEVKYFIKLFDDYNYKLKKKGKIYFSKSDNVIYIPQAC